MDAEIELKLFFQLEQQQALSELLDNLVGSEPKGSKNLTNRYFDTPEVQLRRWDMGLRVRNCDGAREQTIKTAGSVVGGIHSRPEYNVDIEQDNPQLSLFPGSIWPAGADIAKVQSHLHCLFNTDFTRRTWHIYVKESLVEVALDIGSVRVDADGESRSEPICELEFELMAGETSALIELGLKVAATIPVRLGKASKAQRGYHLAAKSSSLSLDALTFIALDSSLSLKQTLVTLLGTALERWQLLEAIILESGVHDSVLAPQLCYRLRACVRLLNSTLAQFQLLNPSLASKFSAVEAHLDFIETGLNLADILTQNCALIAKLPEGKCLEALTRARLAQLGIPQLIDAMLNDTCYGELQLALVDLMLAFKADKLRLPKDLALRDFADKLQQASWKKIVNLMPAGSELSTSEYQSLARALDESMFVGVAYGGLYPVKDRDSFRAPWQDLALGIRTLSAYRQLSDLSQANQVDIRDWLLNKEQSLVCAMEHTRRSALRNQPYWG